MSMKTNNLFVKLFLLLLMVLSLHSTLNTVAQQSNPILADTAVPEIKTIKISDISIKSGEVWTNTNRLLETLLTDEEIRKMGVINDSIVALLNGLLKSEMALNLKTKNIRYLNNKKVYWRKFNEVLDIQKTSLASDIKILNEYKDGFLDEIQVWRNTKKVILEEEIEPTVIQRVVELISQLSGVVDQVQQKNDKLLSMLDRTTEEGVLLIEHLDRIDKAITDKTSEIFVRHQPSFFSIKYDNEGNWEFMDPLIFFYEMEVVELEKYLKDNIPQVVTMFLLIIILIIVFRLIKNRLLVNEIDESLIYKQMLVKIFSRNVSAALILGLFTSVIIFTNRPELFKDILRLIVVIPLIIISTTLLSRKYYKFLYLFGLVIYLQFIYLVYPADNLYSILTMFVVGIVEVLVLWSVGLTIYKHPLTNRALNNLFIILIIIHIGFAFVGFVALISGATMLAEVTYNIPILNVFAGILIIITAIIINGLIELGVESRYFQKLNFVRLYGVDLRRKAIGIINFFAVILWLSSMMELIHIKQLVFNAVTNFFTNTIEVGSASFTLWDIIIFFIVIWLSVIISKMTRIVLEKDILNKFSLGKGVPFTIAVMVRYSIIAIGVLLAVAAAGMPVNNITVLFGAFGVGIGFGLQNIFNNIVSGFILLFERPIQIGDTIEVGQLIGSVKSIGIRSSNIRTFDGAEVIVPNGQLISNEVINWTLSDQRRRIEIIAGVAYGSDPHKVKEILTTVLGEHPDVIDEPAPYVYFNALGESSLDFRMLFWTSYSGEWIRIRSEVMFKVHDALQNEGISIPFPQMDVHLRSGDKE